MGKKPKKEKREQVEKRCDDVFGVLYEIKLILGINDFVNWLENYHEVENYEDILEGYKFMVKTLIGMFIRSICDNISFNIEEDFVFHRAIRYVGLEIDAIPNTCPKAIFIKNIYELAKPIWKAKNWDELTKEAKTFSSKFFPIFDNILEGYVIISTSIDKKSAIKYSAILHALIDLNDTQHGLPKGYVTSVFYHRKGFSSEYYQKILQGYKYALQFLWFNLLDKRIFNKLLTCIHLAQSWKEVDKYFGVISREIVRPMEEKMGIGALDKLLSVKKKIPKKSFGILLERKPREKIYSEGEKLNRLLYWYPLEILSSSSIFNGVPAFISVLSGLVKNREIMGIKEKVDVLRIKHSMESEGEYDYSYGILIEVMSNILADYSGWIIFYDCATDYSGFWRYKHSLAESFIEMYEKMDKIRVREIIIDKEKFLQYLKKDVVSKDYKEILEVGEKKKIEDSKLNEAKGLLLELLLYYILTEDNYDKVIWNYKRKYRNETIQMDVVARKTAELYFFECKTILPLNKEEVAKNLKRKIKIALEDDNLLKELGVSQYSGKKLSLCLWKRPSDFDIKFFNQQGVEIVILPDILKSKRVKMDKLNSIFSGKMQKPEEDIFSLLDF